MEASASLRQVVSGCVLLLIASRPALPQTPAASFEQLIGDDTIQQDDTVFVTDASGARVKGTLRTLHADGLVLRQGNRDIQMSESDVQRIQRGDSVQNGLWIGVGAGVAAAWLSPHVFCDLPDDECSAIVLAAVGLPSIVAATAMGAIIDAMFKKTVFRRGPLRSAPMAFGPVFRPHRLGAVAIVGF